MARNLIRLGLVNQRIDVAFLEHALGNEDRVQYAWEPRVGDAVEDRLDHLAGSQAHVQPRALAAELPKRGVDYRHLPALGGRRLPRRDSPNGGWEHEAFRGYADYALTDEFAAALEELCAAARERPTAVMCAEALWWRCHRRLIADRLTALGSTVCHIAADGGLTEHQLPPFAIVDADKSVRYPPPQAALPGL